MSAHRSREPSSPIFAFDDPKMSVDHDPTMIFGPLDDFDDQHHQHHSALGVGVGALDLDLDMDMGLSFGIGIGLSPYLPPATAHNQQHQQNLQNNKYPFVEYDPEFASSPSMHPFPASPDSTSSQLDSGSAYHPQHQHHHMSPASLYSSSSPSPLSLALNASPDIPDNIYTHWLTDPDGAPSPVSASSTSVPIPIPNHLQAQPQQVHVYAQSPHHPHQHHPLSYVTFPSTSFASDSSYSSSSAFPDVAPFSPTTAYAALQRLPRSFSPYEHEDAIMTEALRASPRTPSSLASSSPASYSVLLSDAAAPFAAADEDVKRPQWASQLWSPDANVGVSTYAEDALDEDAFATQRPRRVSARMGLGLGVPMPLRRPTLAPVAQLFQSSSAPPASAMGLGLGMGGARSYSSRAGTESEEREGERDATIRKKKRASVGGGENAGMGREGEENGERARVDSRASEGKSSRDSPPLKSTLRPPKLAPSAWQLYFTDWIQRHQASSTKKLNVAQAAKEAGQEYARLSEEEKEPYKLRSLAAKEARERSLAAYMRTLTPDDIKRENAFRAAQRKAGKSRRGNMKDPNAPKKPLSAYFMFLQRIRADERLVREVFGGEGETTRQSVLAAARWRAMTDEERKPFLAQAEQEKLEYEAARKIYEEGTLGYAHGSGAGAINFSVLPPAGGVPWPASSTSSFMTTSAPAAGAGAGPLSGLRPLESVKREDGEEEHVGPRRAR